MEERSDTFKKNPIAWTIFAVYIIGWLIPILISIFFTSSAKNQYPHKGQHSPFTGFLTISICYLLFMLTMAFFTKKGNIYLELSGYIGFSLIIFIAIYNG